jgi:hypothetical protein
LLWHRTPRRGIIAPFLCVREIGGTPLDDLIPLKRLKQPKRKPKNVSPEQLELSALFELRWVAIWLEQFMKGDLSVSFVQAKQRVESFLQRIEDRA